MNYYFFLCNDSLLLTREGKIPEGDTPPLDLQPWQTMHHLPDLEEHTCYGVRLDAPVTGDDWQMISLRESYHVLPLALYTMAGKAREILYWDQNTRFCGVCGAPMKLRTDISKRCTNCGKEVWPSLATAIIVAVTRNEGKEILLVQSKNFKKDYLGLVAGFVETGETLEQCVGREVMEETHIRIKNIRYFGSQPWPYPIGLMVGFTAEYDGGELRLQRSELNKGGWHSRENLPAVPDKLSIARRMIDYWYEHDEGCK